MEINLYKNSPGFRDEVWRLVDDLFSHEFDDPHRAVNDVLEKHGIDYDMWDIVNKEYALIKWGVNKSLDVLCGQVSNHLGHVWSNHRLYRNVAQDYSQCPLCGKFYITEYANVIDGEAIGAKGKLDVCEECSDIFWVCCDCGEIGTGEKNAKRIDDYSLCADCFDKEANNGDILICEGCGRWTEQAEDYEDLRGRMHIICPDCLARDDHHCEQCGVKMMEHFDQFRFDGDTLYCKDCYSPIAVVADYDHFEPNPPILQLSSERLRPDTLMFGLEFELEMDWTKFYQNNWTERHIGKKMADCTPKDQKWGYVKHDGSMKHGVEFVTNPMTEQFYVKRRPELNEIFAKWKKAGFRTDQWDDDKQRYNCSLHMHMSKAAFTSGHLYKFVKFVYKAHMRKLVQAISQRDANEFAQFKKDDFRHTAQLAKDKANVSGVRYSVINLIGGHWHEHKRQRDGKCESATVEFRLFNGSTDPDVIHKNIEFMLSVFRFTRDNSITHITQKNYFKYLRDNRNRYRHLINFLNDKLGKEI